MYMSMQICDDFILKYYTIMPKLITIQFKRNSMQTSFTKIKKHCFFYLTKKIQLKIVNNYAN